MENASEVLEEDGSVIKRVRYNERGYELTEFVINNVP